jgi:hypothetical protein
MLGQTGDQGLENAYRRESCGVHVVDGDQAPVPDAEHPARLGDVGGRRLVEQPSDERFGAAHRPQQRRPDRPGTLRPGGAGREHRQRGLARQASRLQQQGGPARTRPAGEDQHAARALGGIGEQFGDDRKLTDSTDE